MTNRKEEPVMKKWLESPRVIFGLLRVASIAAILTGAGLSLCGIVVAAGAIGSRGLQVMLVVSIAVSIVNFLLWAAAWTSFQMMCARLMRGESAFTEENSHTLRVIGGSVAVIGALLFLRGLPRLIAAPGVFGVLETLVLPGTFLTVALIAEILRRLLNHAMALEEAQADVV